MKALIRNNRVLDIEKRDIDVFEYYHEDVAKLFVECPDNVELGDRYENGVFIKPNEGVSE